MYSNSTRQQVVSWLFFFGVVVTFIGAILGIYLLISLGVNHTDHVDCLRLHEATGLETRYERSGLKGECYIKVGEQWIPQLNWAEDKE